jgi:hypothetical protein
MHSYYRDHNMIKRMEHTFRNNNNMPLHDIRIALEKWDLNQGQAMQLAESRLAQPNHTLGHPL